jgi:hypothetical protein
LYDSLINNANGANDMTIKFNEATRSKTEAVKAQLISLGYNVVSSGYTNVMVDVGTDSHQIISVNHADVDAFTNRYPLNA